MARRLVTPVIRIDAGYVSRASAVLAGEIVQEQVPWGTLVGERTAGVSSDQAGTNSKETLFQAIFGIRGGDLLGRPFRRVMPRSSSNPRIAHPM
jgi:hypothetical protein